jgi:hypothetical protein
MMNLEGSGCGLILRYSPRIHLDGLSKTQETCQDNQSPGRDLKYEAGVLRLSCCVVNMQN